MVRSVGIRALDRPCFLSISCAANLGANDFFVHLSILATSFVATCPGGCEGRRRRDFARTPIGGSDDGYVGAR